MPYSGEVRFRGIDLRNVSVEERVLMGVILVPEKRELFPRMTVHDNLILGGFCWPWDAR
jgi:branched-chain amino acid transport system ATP-binding protein